MSMRWLLLALCLLPLVAIGEDFPPKGNPLGTITLYSTLDIDLFEPLLVDFQRAYPGIGVHYENLDAMSQYQRFVREADAGIQSADLLINTSMDLQVKLVNDGYAAEHRSASVDALPPWAVWRNEAFGFTFEPAVMVFNKSAMQGQPIPQSRAELIDRIRRNPKFWRSRIGTYDISKSSMGYMLISQDFRHSSEFGALVEAFGEVDLQVEDSTTKLLERIESGDLVAGYNLLASHVRSRLGNDDKISLVYPRDHTLVVTRTVIIPRNAPHAALAHMFLEHLLSLRGQRVLAAECGLPPIRKELDGVYEKLGINESQVGVLRPISLGPGLLVYLDQEKRRKTLEVWRAILSENKD